VDVVVIGFVLTAAHCRPFGPHVDKTQAHVSTSAHPGVHCQCDMTWSAR